ncbi:MAG: hypothetical protein DHS20C12_30540 [Pseudohongiella sp.]|nr:MAG: hypothetical protein DHS20C12_30540 [Pseudohongiella sp.]
MIDYVLDKVAPYAANTLISVNRNLRAYEYPKLQLLKDEAGSSNGPLAGIFSAMLWCQKNAPEVRHLACAPADVPYFAEETYRLLITAAIENKSHISWVAHDGQAQPLFSVWPIELIPQVKQALSSGIYGVKILIQRLPNTVVELRRSNDLDFRNINTQEELNLLELAASARESL